jgi:YD repeat-containing protein
LSPKGLAAEERPASSTQLLSARAVQSVRVTRYACGMIVYLAVLMAGVAACALASVVATGVVSRRRDEAYRAEQQLIATRRPKTITTYGYDESGALISAKTGPATAPGDQTPA